MSCSLRRLPPRHEAASEAYGALSWSAFSPLEILAPGKLVEIRLTFGLPGVFPFYPSQTLHTLLIGNQTVTSGRAVSNTIPENHRAASPLSDGPSLHPAYRNTPQDNKSFL